MAFDESQLPLPHSFIELFIPPGRHKPTESRAFIAARYELCEDMALMLVEPARTRLWELGLSEDVVLQRMHRGLAGPGAVLTAAEARWVVCRLAELLEWPQPAWPEAPPPAGA
jgi:hypothetical protein